MITQKEVQENTVGNFSFLKGLGLKKITVKDENGKTKVRFLGQEIGIEIELDWFDVCVYALLVKLEKGKVPGGYYLFNGKKVRVPLLQTLRKIIKPAIDVEMPKIYPKKIPNDTEARLMLMESQSEKLAQYVEKMVKLLPDNKLDLKLIFE